ncbi:MAG: DUF502 domain-containing protein [Cytophagales bacterium]|nr:MAG: DUF502 domain-containing protein [Cytophagales bacterium]
MKIFLRFFIRGVVFVIPILITIYIIYTAIRWTDSLLPSLFNLDWYFGEGLIAVVLLITLVGYIASTIIAKSLFQSLEYYLYKIPFINLVYSSTKDIVGAIVGDSKKFNQPVIVKWSSETNAHRIGFITQEDLSSIHLHQMVAVYFPDSYNISGNLFLVPKEHVTFIDISSSEIMKFVVSGGVSGLSR